MGTNLNAWGGSGVGAVRAAALESWRSSLEQRAQGTAPTSVGIQERTAIRQQFAAQKKRYEAAITQAEGVARRKRDQLQQRITTRRQQPNEEKQQHQVATLHGHKYTLDAIVSATDLTRPSSPPPVARGRGGVGTGVAGIRRRHRDLHPHPAPQNTGHPLRPQTGK
ncbi:hypothetical protein [Streptomyces albipurpureus]|uniref:Uncharacterized protein n=1 Tax=Streptomyces albipurpureus TaxID=2897419 RepID=A0ABT0URT6_9ACTN|nr:hypothetical protein [Streptomyces sp. CWNU-1]MCM2391154.1 hypothetical protein [Streptomyces sp. CWNU-1]